MFGRKKKKISPTKNCFSFGCSEGIQRLMERQDSATWFYHLCKHHPEMRPLEPCKDYRATKAEAMKSGKEMMKMCACNKMRKVV